MGVNGKAVQLRIFVGESDKYHHTPLYEAIVREAHAHGLAGATAWRGCMSWGPASHLRTVKILDLSVDLPMIVEIVDTRENIDRFLPKLKEMFETSGCGGLFTTAEVEAVSYKHGN